MPTRHPNADVKRKICYKSLEFSAEIYTRDTELEVTNLWIVFEAMGSSKIIQEMSVEKSQLKTEPRATPSHNGQRDETEPAKEVGQSSCEVRRCPSCLVKRI